MEMEELQYENYDSYLCIDRSEKNWRAGQYDIETDNIFTYNIGFGKRLTITNSTAYKQQFSCNCDELIGEYDYNLKKNLNRLNDKAKCVGFCLAYQFVMSKLMASKRTDKKSVEYWTEKKNQLKTELMEQKFSDPVKYFNGKEEFLQFVKAAKLNQYDELFLDQSTAVEKADKKVAMKEKMKENLESAIQKVKAPSKKLIACISQCVALITNKIKTKQAENKAYKERTMF